MGSSSVQARWRRAVSAAVLVLATTPTLAEDLVMPFACEAQGGGRVSVMPVNEERSYRILGPREHHVFSVCAPDDASRCRNWMIHRFDVACDGGRVPWLRIAEAALSFGRQKAWVEAGHMRLELDPRWGVGAREPYGSRPWDAPGGDADAPYGRDGARPPAAGPDSVELPSGFAPTLGLPVSFVDGVQGDTHSFDAVSGPPPQPNAAEPRGRFARNDRDDEPWRSPDEVVPAQGAAAPVPPGWAASPVPPPRKEKPAAVAQAKPAEPAAPTPKVQKPAPLKPAVQPDVPAASAPASAPQPSSATPAASAAPAGSVAPTIINGAQGGGPSPVASPPAAETPKAPEPAKTETVKAETVKTDPPKAETPAEPKAEAKPSEPTPQKPATSTIPDVGLTAATKAEPQAPAALPFAPWMLALAAALLAAGGAAALLWRREEPGPSFAERDLTRVSFGTGRDLVPVAAEAPSAEAMGSPAQTIAGDYPVPTTAAEALAVLGASSDAGPAALKKIVDGLRQSWHPDLARSPEDRAERERRIAQINVAWDILEARERPAA